MKIKLLSLLALCTASQLIKAEQDEIRIKWTPADVEQLYKKCPIFLDYFLEKVGSTLTKRLTDSEKVPAGVLMAVHLTHFDFESYVQDKEWPVLNGMHKMFVDSMTCCLLQEHPDAQKQLYDDGFLQRPCPAPKGADPLAQPRRG